MRPTREETRQAILKAGEEVFRERGYQPASIEEIAARAGFTKGAVYSSFANKDEIFLELFTARVERRSAHVMETVRAAAPGEAQAHALGVALTGLMDSEPDWIPLLLEFWVHALRDPELRAKLGALRQRVRHSLAAGFGSDTPVSPEMAATLVFALANGLALERLTDPASVPDFLLPTVLERLLHGYVHDGMKD